MVELCTTTGCTDACTPGCGKGRCKVGRKHSTRGGVCCITCSDICDGCGGSFYVEFLTIVPDGRIDPEDGLTYDARYCHCCQLEHDVQ